MGPEIAPEGIDPSIVSPARMYDYLLGGTHNFKVDQAAADYVLRFAPELRDLALENRKCLRRFVNFATSSGIRQFLDIGSGLPTAQNVHQIAQQALPDARTAYVDSDYTTLLHASALLSDDPNTVFVKADATRPRDILDHPDIRQLLNFDEPIAVLMIALLHFVPNGANPRAIVAEIMNATPKGSMLAITHATSDDIDPALNEFIKQMYTNSPAPLIMRSGQEIENIFGALPIAEGKLVDIGRWGVSEGEAAELGRMRALFGYAIKD
ncbi:SAM-dependent methyltransferase [Streptosporangium canum]|uniref:SAM-dependent methyltransferase n=1 Tax=Streptosporangium canum TaxID=324952 RepID=UPI00378E8FAE